MRYFKSPCANCRKREECTRICSKVEKLLPKAEHLPQADFDWLDREIVWSIQDHEDELPAGLRQAAHLYYRLGWSQKRVAEAIGVSRGWVAQILCRIRERNPLSLTKKA